METELAMTDDTAYACCSNRYLAAHDTLRSAGPTSGWATMLKATRHIGDFTNWTNPQTYQQTFDRLLRDLKKADA